MAKKLRFRKSINLGGGTRLNLSKSGVGFSAGTKGARVSKKAGGGTRTTLTAPGTGFSYVSETGAGKNKTKKAAAKGAAPVKAKAKPQRTRGYHILIASLLALLTVMLLLLAVAYPVAIICAIFTAYKSVKNFKAARTLKQQQNGGQEQDFD